MRDCPKGAFLRDYIVLWVWVFIPAVAWLWDRYWSHTKARAVEKARVKWHKAFVVSPAHSAANGDATVQCNCGWGVQGVFLTPALVADADTMLQVSVALADCGSGGKSCIVSLPVRVCVLPHLWVKETGAPGCGGGKGVQRWLIPDNLPVFVSDPEGILPLLLRGDKQPSNVVWDPHACITPEVLKPRQFRLRNEAVHADLNLDVHTRNWFCSVVTLVPLYWLLLEFLPPGCT